MVAPTLLLSVHSSNTPAAISSGLEEEEVSERSREGSENHYTVDNPVLFYNGLNQDNTTLLSAVAVTMINVTVETNQTTPTVVAN